MSDEPKINERHQADNLEHRIRERAHHLWELEGRQEGRADEYWHRAIEQLQSDAQAAYPPSHSRGHRA
ncbi:DUF2934 domain-containing protein [Bradyrhizobium sp. 182]|uniref:DUF2934 domain-containing protein n=1 Tax=unclassified Bradyrhizobium TaxID=2631580 RepID=UPI001FF707BC|nr:MULTISPECIES: DUF2934 domain-containing protein [unclassified Bradyrhizobium]MCK1422478.1 DUF2934 domain-containing protein [Bradyrhizobium sp. CW12]MCK1527991.1 DUF2934 domain-containing protein [Bradyrhizobium sp. 182]MCK1648976.1 DUF2934 domain-containing protein [Bradyrhizobium sp. 154]MCK1667738.1 DUF2934 domain-containing protein [Bradyrhizobium sp. 153]